MRAKVSVTTRNRLLKLEHYGSKQRRVGGWPPIMGIDEWETMASSSQDALVSAAQQNNRSNAELLNTTMLVKTTPIPRQSKPGDILSYLPIQKLR